MATAIAPRRGRRRQGIHLRLGRRRPQQQARCAARRAAASETVVTTNLRRQGIRVTKIKKQTFRGGRRVNEKDITFFTRQLATMLKAGVPLLQSFDIVARGHSNARFSRLMMDIKNKVETGLVACRRRSASTRRSSTRSIATWSPPAKRPACSTRSSTASRPTRKRSSRSRARSSRRCSTRSR